MTTIASIVGARPQFIKAGPVSRALRKEERVHEYLIHTGQHYDKNMSDIFFKELEIPLPDITLGIGSGSHGHQTGKMLVAVEKTLAKLKPDLVLVYGDTNSTLAGSLAAVKLNLPVAHVEAGLRSFNRRMPEEINRIVSDHVCDILFSPTSTATENLAREGIRDNVYLVGDVMYDAVLHYSKTAETKSRILEKLRLKKKEYLLATIHRAENVDDSVRLTAIMHVLQKVSEEIAVVFPVHPRTKKQLEKLGFDKGANSQFHTIEPVGYLDMIELERHSRAVVTDSGGVQKEAYFHSVPCVTFRKETEWVELVEAGANKLANPDDPESMSAAIFEMLNADLASIPKDLYGVGNASMKIASILAKNS